MLCGGLLVAFLSGKGAGRKAEKLDKLDETLKSVKKDLKAKEKQKNEKVFDTKVANALANGEVEMSINKNLQ